MNVNMGRQNSHRDLTYIYIFIYLVYIYLLYIHIFSHWNILCVSFTLPHIVCVCVSCPQCRDRPETSGDHETDRLSEDRRSGEMWHVTTHVKLLSSGNASALHVMHYMRGHGCRDIWYLPKSYESYSSVPCISVVQNLLKTPTCAQGDVFLQDLQHRHCSLFWISPTYSVLLL